MFSKQKYNNCVLGIFIESLNRWNMYGIPSQGFLKH